MNWQESARALTAQQMDMRGDWVVPTIAGKPYLAKPPMLYWCELLLARATGSPPGEAHLRWTVALGGLCGILLTYAAARSLFARGVDRKDASESGPESTSLAATAAFWSAAFLATGVLYVRSSRVGELDILLAPFTVAAIWCCTQAWQAATLGLGRRVLLVILGSATAGGAALTKGPPALVSIALAILGGIALSHAWATPPHNSRARAAWLAVIGTLSMVCLEAWFNRDALGSGQTWLAIVLAGLCGSALALAAPLTLQPRLLAEIARSLWKSGIVIVLSGGAAALWLWKQAVEQRIGPEAIARAITQEAGDNLRIFSAEAPVQNAEAVAYGVGLGSIACIACAVWFFTSPPRIARAWWILIAWLVFGFVVFGVAGRGTGRYLTPLWPAIAMLGGIWFSRAIEDLKAGRVMVRIAAVALIAIAAAQSYWYVVSRPRAEGLRSPRDFLAELLEPSRGVDPARLAAVDFWVGSLDFYAGHHVEPITDIGPWIDYPHDETPVADFIQRLRVDGGAYTLLVRSRRAPAVDGQVSEDGPLPLEHLASLGLDVQEIPLKTRFLLDRQRTEVKAVRVRAE